VAHHCENSNTSEGITEQHAQRTGLNKSTPYTEEETSANGSAEGNELNMA